MSGDEEYYVELYIDDFIKRSFRDIADQDYVAARILAREGLSFQFLWSGLQAVEKYLKAILLFNRVSTKNLSHDVEKSIERIETEVTNIAFDFPDDIRDFVVFLNRYGPNRYFEFESATYGTELLKLDRTVWYLRRYCHNLRQIHLPGGGMTAEFRENLLRVASHDPQKPWSASILGGHLEEILAKRSSTLRRHLVWKNFYFGGYKKRTIKWTSGVLVQTPTHELHPTVFARLEPLVTFSSAVKARFTQ